ncbi:MAG: DUF4177 domain-containing protein, partial [Alphaproteobacteria bacterium]
MAFEYKVVPAPTRARRVKGAKTPADRFAQTLAEAMNALAADGWEYLRADTLPQEQRKGLTGRVTVFQTMLVFRRPLAAQDETAAQNEAEPAEKAPAAPPLPSASAAQQLPAEGRGGA